jgi:hypothetical protein
MHASPLTAVFDRWTHPSYEVRVRGTSPPIYLWGSAGVKQNIPFAKPLLLHIRNDVFGQIITFGTQVASGSQTELGTLLPGECISIPIHGISGVFATCQQESVVGCLISELR